MNQQCWGVMHVSLLPINYSIGTFGKEACHFVDFF